MMLEKLTKRWEVSNHLGKMGVIGSLASGVSTYLERKDKYGDEVTCKSYYTGITATSTVIGSVYRFVLFRFQ